MGVLIISFVFAVTFTGIFVLTKYFPNVFLDKPDNLRKDHSIPVPYSGGIIFGSSIILGVSLMSGMVDHLLWYVCGAIIMMGLGYIDDFKGLAWYTKLSIQSGIGVTLFLTLRYLGCGETFSTLMALYPNGLICLWVLWFVGMVNAVNLTDGVDGLAAGMVCLSSCALVIFGGSLLPLLVCASLLAFLWFNRHPARIYMGDCGSLFLGYHLAVMPLFFSFSSVEGRFSLLPYVMMNTYFIWDTTRVVLHRLAAKQSPFKPDKRHFHFMVLEVTHSKNRTCMLIYGLHAFFILCGVGAQVYPSLFLVYGAYIAGVLFLLFIPYIPVLTQRQKRWIPSETPHV